MKMKILILLFLVLISNLNLLAQNKKFIDIAKNLDLVLLDPVSDINNLLYKKHDDKLYILSQIIQTEAEFYYDLVEIEKNKTINHYKIIIPENLTDRIWLRDFEIYNNEIYLNLQFEIAIFTLNANKIYNYSTSIPKTKILEGIKIIDDKLYGYGSKFDIKEEFDSTLTFVWSFDLKNKTEKLTYYEDPLGIEWTKIQPRKLIDLHKSKLIISDAKRYKMRIYDVNTNELLDTIEILDEINDENIDLSKYHKLQDDNKLLQAITSKLFDNRTNVDLIESVNMLSENKIVVVKSIGDSLNYKCLKFFDMWEKKENKWERTHKNLVSGMQLKEDNFAYENMFIENMLFSEDSFIAVQAFPFKLEDKYFKMKYKDIYILNKEYSSKNDFRYSLLIGQIK